jgi:hypothetical protein
VNNNRELVLEAENVIKQLGAEVQTIALATAAEQRAATAYQKGEELIAAATNQVETAEQLLTEATERFRTAADTVDEKLRDMLNQIESLRTLNHQQVIDALAEATTVRQLIETEHTKWEVAATALRTGLKWAFGIGICLFVLSISTLVYVYWFLRR